ncbi:hypothetical protein [Pseudobutyrivibrio xylanivorans]|uniref:SipW-cognate class signal peptide n=1 Tax=Pseudobutyrivibrio xylanivorans DSM 14809 TaxID=1123012 RepID=A0A1M6DPG0_PSEXY|nr:hypothetical protein [Pseudobutyrivibrio xylanivorans]SHI75127.1 hypothetical protein SAMN02745725_00987 [Pseudobutyrivibrio xylanivorans DSM 14809]
MKTKWLYLVAAVVLVLSISAVKPALAYFTATKTVDGTTKALEIKDSPPYLDEEIDGMIKKIVITNNGDSDIFVRARAIAPDNWTVKFTATDGWIQEGDYYYYTKPIAPSEPTATQLTLEILPKQVEEEYDVPDSFNVVIVQEATKVYYDEAGNPIPDDWANAITNSINVGR